MALIINGKAKEFQSSMKGTSVFCLEIDSDYLRRYDIGEGDILYGHIEKIKVGTKEIEELADENVEFVVLGIGGLISISEKSYKKKLREYGLVKAGFQMSIIFDKAKTKEGKEVEMYPKRDVVCESR